MNLKLFGTCLVLVVSACGLSIDRPIDGSTPDKTERPDTQSNVQTRLRSVYWTAEDGSKFIAPWWFWANPDGNYLPYYAQDVYKPLQDIKTGTPHTWRPFYDTHLQSPCLFYQTDDGEVRCLPGWPQMEPDDLRDGFYDESTCNENKSHWLYVLPTSETVGVMAQKFLVVARPIKGVNPSVYDAKPYNGRVWWKRAANDGSRQCEEISGDNLKFFKIGDMKNLSEFVKLGPMVVDIGPN